MDGLTFAALLTPEGVVAAAALTTAFIALVKNVFPVIDAKVSGALMAFVFTGILYVLAAFATNVSALDAGLTVFMAWVSCATSAIGINSAATHVVEVRSN